MLAAKYALGLFDSPLTDPQAHVGVVNSPKHQALALEAAEQGIVLLKNDAGWCMCISRLDPKREPQPYSHPYLHPRTRIHSHTRVGIRAVWEWSL